MHDFLQLILHMLRYGFRRFLAVLGVCLLLIGLAYLLCRKRGKEFPWGKAITIAVLAGYGAVLLYVTLLRQVGLGSGQANLHLFRAWREAWNCFSLQNWLNVLLNVALFVPLGFLAPFLAGVFRRWYVTLLTGFGTSLAIETAQYFLGRGMFDVDDLFTNTLGVLLGFSAGMALIKLHPASDGERKGWLPYLACPGAFALALVCIFGRYQLQEYGNLAEAPAFAADLRGVEWQAPAEPADTADKVPVYWAEPFTRESCEAFGAEFAHGAGVTFPDAYYYDDLTIFANHSAGAFLDVYYHDRSYEFTSAAAFGPAGTAEEALLRELLAGYGIDIPAEAGFADEGDGWYAFTAEFLPRGDAFINGTLRCKYLESGQIKYIENGMVSLALYGEEAVLTGEEALERLKKGLFQGSEFLELMNVRRVEVLSCRLEYRADTKGFYQPVYVFRLWPEGLSEGEALVPAMK